MKLKRVAIVILICLFAYLTLFTWNLRTGHLDGLSSYTGLEFTAWVLKPGKWVAAKVEQFWERYVYLVGLRQENDRLRASLEDARLAMSGLREKAGAAERLEKLLLFSPSPAWTKEGARIIAHRLGPASALESVLVDKGRLSGIKLDTPVVVPEGVVGRVLRTGLTASTVLLLTDPNCRIPVLGQTDRSGGILAGQGPDEPLRVLYVNLNAPLREGELLVTSGLARIFPKGLPVARVTAIERSTISLFLHVTAEPLVDLKRLEEVLLLLPDTQWSQAGKEEE